MLLGVTDIAALQRRSLGEWVPALQRARLAARLRDAAVQRQDLQLDIEVAGEAAREVKAVVVNLDIPVVENVDRAMMAAGSGWAASTSEADGVQSAQVARWQPLGFRSVSAVSPEEPTVTVSTGSLTRSVSQVTPVITTITPDTTTITGTFTSPNITIWSFADRRLQTRIVVSLAGVLYFGLVTPSTGDVVLAQLST